MAKKNAAEDTVPLADPAPDISQPVAESTDVTAVARLKAFEDKHGIVSEHAPLVNDRIQRGIGSPFAKMSAEHRAQHAALERLVAAEAKLAEAHAVLIAADAECEAAHAAAA